MIIVSYNYNYNYKQIDGTLHCHGVLTIKAVLNKKVLRRLLSYARGLRRKLSGIVGSRFFTHLLPDAQSIVKALKAVMFKVDTVLVASAGHK